MTVLDGVSLLPAGCVELTVIPPPTVEAASAVDTVHVAGWSRDQGAPPVTSVSVVLRAN